MSDTEKSDVIPSKQEEEMEPEPMKAEEKAPEEKMEEDSEKVEEKKEEETKKEDDVEMEEDQSNVKSDSVEPSPKKSPKKRKKVEKENVEEEEEEELPLGLLERPVVIESGKREKRKVERLAMTMSFTPQQKKKIDVPEGTGTKLGDCPRIEFKISHMKTDNLVALHRIIFGSKGTHMGVKRNLRQFCGFSFSKEDKDYDKRLTSIGKLTLPVLRTICEVLDLERSGVKEDIVQRVMDFLMHPTSSGKAVPVPKKRGKAPGKKEKGVKRKRTEKKEGKKKKKKPSKEDVDSENEDDEEEEDDDKSTEQNDRDDDDDDADEDGDVEDEEEESEEEPPKKKKAKVETPKKPKKDAEDKKKKENGKKEKEKPAKKAEKKEPKKKKVVPVDSDSDDSDDESLASKKAAGPPNNEELRDVVKKILDGANLEEVTMKTVVKQVYAKYPDFDLSDKKEFIKNTVKQLIS